MGRLPVKISHVRFFHGKASQKKISRENFFSLNGLSVNVSFFQFHHLAESLKGLQVGQPAVAND